MPMLTMVKYWLVLLLALILPVKGVMATAGVLCHDVVQPLQSVQQDGAHQSHQANGAHEAHEAHEAGDPSVQTQGTSCLACAAVCGASSLPASTALSLPVSEPTRDWRVIAAIEPPSPSLRGLERPPRSI
jgi:hypothetical protein